MSAVEDQIREYVPEREDSQEADDPLMLGPHQPTKVRSAFVKTVLAIVGMQMLFVFLSCFAVSLYFSKNPWILLSYGFTPLWIGVSMVLAFRIAAFWPSNLRSYPGKYAWLALLTLGYTFIVAPFAPVFRLEILIAIETGVAIYMALIVYTSTINPDFTGFGPYIVVLIVSTIGNGVGAFVVIQMRSTLGLGVLITLGALLVVRNLQLVMAKDFTFKLYVDDYIFGAVLLYINSFLMTNLMNWYHRK